MKKIYLFFLIFSLFQFETKAQSPENFIPPDSAIEQNQQIPANAVDSSIQNSSNKLAPMSDNTNEQDVAVPKSPLTPTIENPSRNTDATLPAQIQVSTPAPLRSIAAIADNSLPPHNCQEFLSSIETCHKDACKGEACLTKSCEFHKKLNQETYLFSVSFIKDSKSQKCNLKHEIKNSKNEVVEFFDCKFNALQMRQAKVYYTRFLENSEFNFEKPVCIEPTADGGRKIASTCEMSFNDGLKLINIFELGKKFNQCL